MTKLDSIRIVFTEECEEAEWVDIPSPWQDRTEHNDKFYIRAKSFDQIKSLFGKDKKRVKRTAH